MRKIQSTFTILILIILTNCEAQEDTEFDQGSRVNIGQLTESKITDLELLGRIWGFLKYHHPAVADGKYNWDYELFRILPKYLPSVNKDSLLVSWISSLGELSECNYCPSVQKDAVLTPDLTWMDNLSGQLKQELLYIYNNRAQGNKHYVEMKWTGSRPKFTNEDAYSNMPFPDEGFRLLSLYRYWNIINYFFPYRNLTDKPWGTILHEYIPILLNAKDELEYELAVLQLIGEVNDTHANLFGGHNKIENWKGKYFAPIQVRFIQDKLIVTDYFNPELKSECELRIGDIITEVDGVKIETFIEEKSKYYPASNKPTQLRNMSEDILRSPSQEIKIRYIDAETSKEENTFLKLYMEDSLDIQKWYTRYKEKKAYKIIDDNIGYITLNAITEPEVDDIKKEFINSKGIIIDIRNYPATYVPFLLGSYFVSTDRSFVKFSKGNINHPGEFTFKPFRKIKSGENTYKGKLVVLINELTQSQAEFTAMAFRAGDNTTIVGSTTAGADGDVARFSLPGGLSTAISGIGVFYPNGQETQRIGIIPDIVVKPTIEGIKKDEDELLNYAIRLVSED